jgi:hypothetical protein
MHRCDLVVIIVVIVCLSVCLIPSFYFFLLVGTDNDIISKTQDLVVDVVMPTGAMGNMVAGYMAKGMGLPLGTLASGVNINDITYRVTRTGHFHKNPIMHRTLSEAINIQLVRTVLYRIVTHVGMVLE